jgi:hypothetical protein
MSGGSGLGRRGVPRDLADNEKTVITQTVLDILRYICSAWFGASDLYSPGR